ncbi:MAG: hypothetical protein R3B54_03745 [Bdellovibrionota bacterium]
MQNTAKVNTVFLLPSLELGGAEKTTLNLLSNDAVKDLNPSLWCFRKKGELLSVVPDEISVSDLEAFTAIQAVRSLIAKVRLNRPS